MTKILRIAKTQFISHGASSPERVFSRLRGRKPLYESRRELSDFAKAFNSKTPK